ncbi:hypothetical protein E2C01_096266 [Portunus trituberculatus]|uniref:Uncharacterized protein n=1 Tax=Portunus trituberculatus TaxID=210409 RepID=A0A5B7K6G4_PORTR|nr:hypothetical protein [Portunus trituberculatus]
MGGHGLRLLRRRRGREVPDVMTSWEYISGGDAIRRARMTHLSCRRHHLLHSHPAFFSSHHCTDTTGRKGDGVSH